MAQCDKIGHIWTLHSNSLEKRSLTWKFHNSILKNKQTAAKYPHRPFYPFSLFKSQNKTRFWPCGWIQWSYWWKLLQASRENHSRHIKTQMRFQIIFDLIVWKIFSKKRYLNHGRKLGMVRKGWGHQKANNQTSK